MEREDLETYQVQLSQVEQALADDPDNTKLSSLRSELKELIELTQTHLTAVSAAAPSSSKPEGSRKPIAGHLQGLSAGADCLAKYSADQQWYPARIISVGGSTDKRAYSVVFKGYNNTELVSAHEIKPLPANFATATPASNKRKLTPAEEEEREKKKKKNEKKLEVKAAKAKEQTAKQATWQKFAKKSEKKGVHIAGVSGTSIFKTPDNPMGRGERRSA
jgi:hypothetical protein